VYTRKGDKGETSLVGSAKVSKASARVEAYGDVDELNSFIGIARARIEDKEIDAVLRKIQNDLFTVGADLASPIDVRAPRIEKRYVDELEQLIDKFLAELEPLKEFILPGGDEAGALLHGARAIARRAERHAVKLAQEEEVNDQVIAYINRLSDLLFVLARVANRRAGGSEELVDFGKDRT